MQGNGQAGAVLLIGEHPSALRRYFISLSEEVVRGRTTLSRRKKVDEEYNES